MTEHDALYHRLFTHRGMMGQLLREFINEPWVADLDLETMELVNPKFQAGAIRREADVIWRIPLKSGGEAYLLLLLEFQSSPDQWMALRFLVYAGLLWQQVVREKRLMPDGRLPPVFPLVLYNRDPRWSSPLSLAELVGLPEGSPLWAWQPAMRYRVLDEGLFADADLAARETLAALLFRLENAPKPDEIREIFEAVVAWFRDHDGYEALKSVFATLAYRVLSSGNPTLGQMVVEDLLEVRAMLADRPAQWRAEWTQEGIVLGHRKGEAALLTRQLERRFGVLPEAVQRRIDTADVAELEEWGLRLLDAGSLDEVLH